MASNLVAMASNLIAMASNLVAMASNLIAMASNLAAMASNLIAVASKNGFPKASQDGVGQMRFSWDRLQMLLAVSRDWLLAKGWCPPVVG